MFDCGVGFAGAAFWLFLVGWWGPFRFVLGFGGLLRLVGCGVLFRLVGFRFGVCGLLVWYLPLGLCFLVWF